MLRRPAVFSRSHMFRVGQNRTYILHTYIRCIYGIFNRKITIHTIIYGVHIRFWPTLHMLHSHCVHTCCTGLLCSNMFHSHCVQTCFVVTVFTHAAQAYCVQTCYTVTVFTHVSQSLCSHMLRRPTVFKHVSQSLCSNIFHSHCVHTCYTGLLC